MGIESLNEQRSPLLGTRDQLIEGINARSISRESPIPNDQYKPMGYNLAKRMLCFPGGINPADYVRMVEHLLHDISKGFDQHTGELMPPDLRSIKVEDFLAARLTSITLARDSFGPEYAEEVSVILLSITRQEELEGYLQYAA